MARSFLHKRTAFLFPLFLIAVASLCNLVQAADYQFGLELPNPGDNPLIWTKTTAFLWVPPRSAHLRGVILAPANVIERRFSDDPIIRAEAERDDLAIVFFQAGWKSRLTETPQIIDFVESMLGQLADKSGYDELRTIPWIPVGHSGNSEFCQGLARFKPQRTLANIVIKGALPGPDKNGSVTGLAGIPILFVTGEFEEVMPPGKVRNAWWNEQMKKFRRARAAVPDALIGGMIDRSHGHLNWMPDLSTYAALFIHKAVIARFADPANPTRLCDIPFDSGWLCDPEGKHPCAPVKQYAGIPADAFWVFDEEQSRVWRDLFFRDLGKKEQLLAFEQDGNIAPWWSGWGLQGLEFRPLADGVSFTVAAQFRDEVPEPFADAHTKLGHGDPAKITYRVLGWANNTEQTGPNTFRVGFDREGVNGRTVHILIGAEHPGDNEYRATVAVASLDIPYSNSQGASQTITFPPIADIKVGTASVSLAASVDSPLPVRYYISWGPAELDGDTIRLTAIPARARFPIDVKVTAYQWGKATPPLFATANSVTRTFHILNNK